MNLNGGQQEKNGLHSLCKNCKNSHVHRLMSISGPVKETKYYNEQRKMRYIFKWPHILH